LMPRWLSHERSSLHTQEGFHIIFP
jgi:hypothetical protein